MIRKDDAMRSPRRPTAVLLGATAGVLVAILGVLSFTTTEDVAPPASPAALAPAAVSTPLASPSGFYVDPRSPAARQRREWAAAGRTEDARRIGRIAAQPVPDWLTQPTGSVGAEVTGYVGRAVAARQRPLLVAYHVPNRDCGSYSGGGAADAADYRVWIREVAAALRGRRPPSSSSRTPCRTRSRAAAAWRAVRSCCPTPSRC